MIFEEIYHRDRGVAAELTEQNLRSLCGSSAGSVVSKSRVHMTLKKPVSEDFGSGAERSGAFKRWLSGK